MIHLSFQSIFLKPCLLYHLKYGISTVIITDFGFIWAFLRDNAFRKKIPLPAQDGKRILFRNFYKRAIFIWMIF